MLERKNTVVPHCFFDDLILTGCVYCLLAAVGADIAVLVDWKVSFWACLIPLYLNCVP